MSMVTKFQRVGLDEQYTPSVIFAFTSLPCSLRVKRASHIRKIPSSVVRVRTERSEPDLREFDQRQDVKKCRFHSDLDLDLDLEVAFVSYRSRSEAVA